MYMKPQKQKTNSVCCDIFYSVEATNIHLHI